MSILVTGGAGYVGSHTVKRLVESGEKVIVIDDLSAGHKGAVSGAELVVGDFGDKDLMRNIIKSNDVEAVFHFAAFASVDESVRDPKKYYFNNIANSLSMLEVMVETGVDKMVFSSSAATFGEPKIVPIPEDHPKDPTNPYGRSKLQLEEILKEYERAYGLRSISLRYFNASGASPDGKIGEDHRPEHHIIPLVLDVARGKREKFFIFGTDWPTRDNTCVRDYVHVSDLAQAHTLALDALRDGHATDVYNLGNGEGYTVKELIAAASKVTGKDITAVPAPRRAGDPAVLVAGSEKIKKDLGWKPEYPELEVILKTAWNWHTNNPNGFDD